MTGIRHTLAIAAIAVAFVLEAGCSRRPDPASDASTGAAEPAARAEYVGGDACRSCHRGIAATYQHTGMGRSWYPMSSAVAVEDFERDNVLELAGTGLTYRMTARDGRYVMTQYHIDSTGAEIAVDDREMLWVAGSGNHSRSYVTEVEGRLFQLPVCWYPLASTWDLCPGYEYKNDGFTRAISTTCVFCHNARMELEAGARGRFKPPVPAGIDCERCHGPGSLHLDRWRGGEAPPGGGPDATIVNPSRLPPLERMQICMQCHFGDALASERVARHDRTLEAFRPGMKLTDLMVPFRFTQPTARRFGISAQADRFILSRCFVESGGRIDCLTCHDPHVTVYADDRPPDAFRKACLGCHRESSCTGVSAERAATTPTDDCVRCHMRRAEPDDHPHAAFTDHWIRARPSDGRDVRTSIDMEPVFRDEFEALPAADRAYVTGRAYFLKAMEAPPVARRMMWSAAESAFRDAIASGFSEAAVHFFLGKTLGFLGRDDEAAAAFEEAFRRDRADHDVAFAWGQALLERNRIEEAATVFERMLEVRPDSAAALAELGRCRLMAGRAQEGLDLYDRATRAEPWNASLYANRAAVLVALGRFDEACDLSREAVRRAPEDLGIWRAYREVAARAGRAEELREAERIIGRLARRPAPPPASRGMMGL